MAYFLGDGWTDNFLIDPSGKGLEDACERRIRLPIDVSQREDWLAESFPTKLLRLVFGVFLLYLEFCESSFVMQLNYVYFWH
jgi:hypothetical protein